MTFERNTRDAKIHGLSVQVGELFADLYRTEGACEEDSLNALEAYKSLRRLLPAEWVSPSMSRHVGHLAAHNATQGN